MRFKLVVAYDGTAYHGWQLQANGVTLQAVLEGALLRVFGTQIRVFAAGRTDAGVHAAGQVVTFDAESKITARVVQRALEALTPRDVSVLSAELVADDFDVRRHATSRCYEYRIWNARVRSPFWRTYAWHVKPKLDIAAMQQAAAALLGVHDFSAFRAAGCDALQPMRRVLRSELRQKNEMLIYEIEANSFLRHMVRNIVGTLVQVGCRQRPPADVEALLAQRDRNLAGPTAPAHGLCLTAVRYGK
jgi:tRNA pseudouridine38-40 synthase